VIYVGDGIGTTGDADPVALASRLKGLAAKSGNVFHAVYTGSTYEKGVLETIASLGGGSVRAVGDDPTQTAYTLLAESAQPAVKNLQVSFEGIRIARVYPEQLPNLPIGTQQVILGRFLPTSQDQQGDVVVTGTIEGKPVRYTAKLRIRANETGNSFTPRLWARRHLDALLAQGRSAQVKEDIVAFSQEFGIMTPYTSFLVLENDEDRKRYGVERRVSMRDGERFFAKGRNAASTQILRQQMKLARTWRLNMRYQMLRQIAELGRSLHGWSVAIAQPVSATRLESNLGFGRSLRGRGGGRRYGRRDAGRMGGEWNEMLAKAAKAPMAEAKDKSLGEDLGEAEEVEEEIEDEEEFEGLPAERAANLEPARKRRAGQPSASRTSPGFARGGYLADFDMGDAYGFRLSREAEIHPAMTFASLGFPHLGRPGKDPLKLGDPDWPAEVLAIVRSLDRRPTLKELAGGLGLARLQESLHAAQGRVTHWSGTRLGFTAGSWLTHSEGRGAQPSRAWLLDGKRGVAVLGLKLGRVRDGVERDQRFPIGLSDYSTSDLPRSWRNYQVAMKELGDGNVQITFTAPLPQRSRFQLEIDRRRKVVVKARTFDRDYRVTEVTTFSDFVEVSGTWWAQKIERRNKKNQVVHRQELSVKASAKDDMVAEMRKLAAVHSEVLFIGAVDPKLEDAKQAVHENKAGFAEHMRVALHYAATQQWEKVWGNVDRASGAEGKFAVPFMKAYLRTQSRQGEEFRSGLGPLVETTKTAAANTKDFLAGYVCQLGNNVLGSNERLSLLESLKSVYEVAGRDATWRDLHYRSSKARLLWNLGQREEALL
ncbi:MAG: hypothetical protein V3U11_09980, partial [Planctomycetota bacterium]